MTRMLGILALFFLPLLAACAPSPEGVNAQMARYARNTTGNALTTAATTHKPVVAETESEDQDDQESAEHDAPGTTTGESGGVPVAVLEDNVFDFGTMEPFQSRSHSFVIKNVGDAPLQIRAGASSCKCTLGEVGDGVIPPNGESTVTLTWKSSDRKKLFAHEAEVLTNDPKNKVLICRVTGKIQQTFAIEGEFVLPAITPGEEATSAVVLASEVWNDFEILDIKSTMDDVVWDVQPLGAEERSRKGVRVGYRLKITIPRDLPRGYFRHTLSLKVRPSGESERLVELPIEGKVLRRVSIYGSGIDSTGTIKLGKVRAGHGISKAFTVKVRDREPNLDIEALSADPEYLQLSFVPNEKIGKPGHYRMLLEVPKDAPAGSYMGRPAQLRVKFKNPRLEEMELRVEYAILGEI